MWFRSRRAFCGVGSALAAFFAGATAPAGAIEPLPAPIVAWAAPPECPNAESVFQRLMALGGGSARRFADAGTVRGELVRDADEWILSLRIAPSVASGSIDDGARPARLLRAHDCDDLAEAGAVAIAIALGGRADDLAETTLAPSRIAPASIGPARLIAAPPYFAVRSKASIAPAYAASSAPSERVLPFPEKATDESVLGPVEDPISESAPSPAEDAAREDVPEVDDPAAPASSTFGFQPSAGLVLDTASLGGAALGPGAELELRWGVFGAGAYGLWLPPREISVASAQSVELSLLSAGLRGCYRAADELPIIDMCAGGEFGALSAAGKGLLDATRRRDPWGAATGGVLLGLNLGHLLRAGARLEAVLPLSRERYLVNQNTVVHEVPAASLRLGVLLAGSFGKH